MTSLDSASLKSAELLADWGTWLVIIGVAGEGIEIALKICEHKIKNEGFLAWCKKHNFAIEIWGGIFWLMVVGGLVMEFRGNHQAQQIVQQENGRITQQAGEAIKEAALANERAALARKEAEELRYALMSWRIDDLKASAEKLSRFKGTVFKVITTRSRFNTDITAMLDMAGWKAMASEANTNVGSEGVIVSVLSTTNTTASDAAHEAATRLVDELWMNGVAAIQSPDMNKATTNCIVIRIGHQHWEYRLERTFRQMWETNGSSLYSPWKTNFHNPRN